MFIVRSPTKRRAFQTSVEVVRRKSIEAGCAASRTIVLRAGASELRRGVSSTKGEQGASRSILLRACVGSAEVSRKSDEAIECKVALVDLDLGKAQIERGMVRACLGRTRCGPDRTKVGRMRTRLVESSASCERGANGTKLLRSCTNWTRCGAYRVKVGRIRRRSDKFTASLVHGANPVRSGVDRARC